MHTWKYVIYLALKLEFIIIFIFIRLGFQIEQYVRKLLFVF